MLVVEKFLCQRGKEHLIAGASSRIGKVLMPDSFVSHVPCGFDGSADGMFYGIAGGVANLGDGGVQFFGDGLAHILCKKRNADTKILSAVVFRLDTQNGQVFFLRLSVHRQEEVVGHGAYHASGRLRRQGCRESGRDILRPVRKIFGLCRVGG